MNIDATMLLNEPVTVFNRLSAKDSGEAEDTYIATEVLATWQASPSFSVSQAEVAPNGTAKALIPSDQSRFVPEGWTGEGYTANKGDYVVRGSFGGRYTAKEARAIVKAVESFTVLSWRDLRGNGAVTATTGLTRWASIVVLEGR